MGGWDAVAVGAAFVAVLAWLPPSAWVRLAGDPPERIAPRAGPWAWRSRRGVDDVARAREVSRACLLLAVCLAAGRPARGALRVVVDVVGEAGHEPLARVLRQIDLGLDEAVAWASLADEPGYGAMSRDLARAVHSGVALAELLERHASDARRQALLAAQVRARAVGVTGVLPLVVCFLPAFLLLGVVPIFGGVLGGVLG